jgi:hypothetical protein
MLIFIYNIYFLSKFFYCLLFIKSSTGRGLVDKRKSLLLQTNPEEFGRPTVFNAPLKNVASIIGKASIIVYPDAIRRKKGWSLITPSLLECKKKPQSFKKKENCYFI